MTNEELAVKAKSGDSDALLKLWEQERGLAYIFARRRYTALELKGNMCGVEIDDLMQAAFLALVSAVGYYDPEKEFSFNTYWGNCIKTEFNSMLLGVRTRKRDPLNNCTSLDAPVSDDEDADTKGDFVADPADAYEESDRRMWLDQLHDAMESALSSLSPDQKKAVRLRYYAGLDRESTAAAMGLDYSACRTVEQHAMRELRKPKQCRLLEPFIDLNTKFYLTGSRKRQSSPVEAQVIWREDLRNRPDFWEDFT